MDDNCTDTIFSEIDSPLLIDGVTDYKGRPALRSESGCWRSAYFIIAVEVAERFAYHGVKSNLITYLTGPLGQSTATAAENVNVWSGTASLLPLVGAFIADGFLGPYLTIIIASLLYIMDANFILTYLEHISTVAMLAFSTLISSESVIGASSFSTQLQVIMFFISLYLVAFAIGGHKPCVQAFGADQFDADNPEERKAKSSFFNWWYFGSCSGTTVGTIVVSYIQDNLSWGLGFGIPCIIMGFALFIFMIGTRTYRFGNKIEEKSALVRIGQVFVKSAQYWRTAPSTTSAHQDSEKFRFLNKALISPDVSNDEVEEAKDVLRLVPIWASCLANSIVCAQTSTLFTKQGATMDRRIGSSFEVPAATLQSFIGISVMVLIPIYDTIMIPVTRAITKKPSGITMLQRIGTGIVISIVSMVVAALTETKRLRTAREFELVDDPNAMVPMKIWWLLPHYLLAGAGDVFTIVAMQEFFYGEMASDLKSIGLALYLSVIGIGSFLSSFLISVVEKTTGGNGKDGWISDNMNQGQIDYFYYLLAGISAGAFVIYIYAAKSYVYNRGRAL